MLQPITTTVQASLQDSPFCQCAGSTHQRAGKAATAAEMQTTSTPKAGVSQQALTLMSSKAAAEMFAA